MATFDIEERYERRDALGGRFAQAVALHLLFAGSLALSAWLHARTHGNEWGQNLPAGSIQATMVSSAPSVPLPQVQKPSDNVLATETPSQAPAIEKKETAPAPDLKAIPIAVKQPAKSPPPKPQPKQQEQKHPQPQQTPKDRAAFGEQQPSSMPKSMAQQQGPASPVAVAGGAGFHYGWYVDQITRKVRENWYIQEVDPSTPKGREVVVTFNIGRDGAPSSFQIVRSSGSSTLDTSGIRAVQRVESFGPLPPGYNGSSLSVQYTFTYDQTAH